MSNASAIKNDAVSEWIAMPAAIEIGRVRASSNRPNLIMMSFLAADAERAVAETNRDDKGNDSPEREAEVDERDYREDKSSGNHEAQEREHLVENMLATGNAVFTLGMRHAEKRHCLLLACWWITLSSYYTPLEAR